MKLLYDRVLLEKVIEKEHGDGIIKHHLSHDMRIEPISKGIVRYTGVDCLEVKEGDVVMYDTALERFMDIQGEKLVEIRESNIKGIWITE